MKYLRNVLPIIISGIMIVYAEYTDKIPENIKDWTDKGLVIKMVPRGHGRAKNAKITIYPVLIK